MEALLQRYCQQESIAVEDLKGGSHANRLSTHRHIFAYCIKKQYPSIKLWQIGTVINIKASSVCYGISTIAYLIKPIIRSDKRISLTSENRILLNTVNSFLEICAMYKRTELNIPFRERKRRDT